MGMYGDETAGMKLRCRSLHRGAGAPVTRYKRSGAACAGILANNEIATMLTSRTGRSFTTGRSNWPSPSTLHEVLESWLPCCPSEDSFWQAASERSLAAVLGQHRGRRVCPASPEMKSSFVIRFRISRALRFDQLSLSALAVRGDLLAFRSQPHERDRRNQ